MWFPMLPLKSHFKNCSSLFRRDNFRKSTYFFVWLFEWDYSFGTSQNGIVGLLLRNGGGSWLYLVCAFVILLVARANLVTQSVIVIISIVISIFLCSCWVRLDVVEHHHQPSSHLSWFYGVSLHDVKYPWFALSSLLSPIILKNLLKLNYSNQWFW